MALSSLLAGLPPPLCRGKVVSAYDPRLDRTPSTRAVAEVRSAYEALCPNQQCGRGEIFRNDSIGDNAVTWVSGIRDGTHTRAKIVYSARFLNALKDSFGAGASFGVLAHEVGHHLTAALALRQPFEPSWNEELRADYLAGCALGRSGRVPAELENALRALASVATPSHPSFEARVPVVRKGYDECRGTAAEVSRRRAFGVGAALDRGSDPARCWGYWYRLKEQVDLVGPVAASRRRSGAFGSREACEAHRADASEKGSRMTEGCTCE